MSEVARTVVIVKSAPLPRRAFKVFMELEGMCRDTVERLVPYAVSKGITKFARLEAEKYREVRSPHPRLPSHHAYAAHQDAAGRVHSFLRLRKRGGAFSAYPEVRGVSRWLDDRLWRAEG
ncbi:MAG: hypothetical protein RXQ62_05475 [Nitrososphaeria archaeon]